MSLKIIQILSILFIFGQFSMGAYTPTTTISGDVTVVGPLTNAQLRATPVPITGNISVSSSADSTAANQVLEIAQLVSIDSTTSSMNTKIPSGLVVSGGRLQVETPVSSGLTNAELRASPVSMNGSGFTQPVSAASLPLPLGAALSSYQASADATLNAISANIALVKSKTDNLDVALSTRSAIASTQPVSGAFWQATQPVSLSTIPLATGAALASWQSSADTTLTSLNNKVTAVNTGAVVVSSSALPSGASTLAAQVSSDTTLTAISGKLPSNLTVTSTRLLVDPSGVTSPVSVASLPLPSGAAQNAGLISMDATLTSLNSKVTAVNTGAVIVASGSITANAGTNLNTSALATEAGHAASTDTSTAAINTKIPANLTVTSTRLLVDPSGVTSPVSLASIPINVSASTSALQTTGNSSLSSIDTKTPALGQATMANSAPVVISSNQSAIGISSDATIISIKTATASSDATLTTLNGKIPSNLTVTSTRLLTDGSGVTQPISGTVTVNALTNSSIVKAQLQDNAGTAVVLGQQVSGSSLPVVLPAAQITTLSAPVVTGSVTANAGTNLNTSALATEAGHAASTDTSTAAINTKIPSNLTVTSTRLLVDPSGVTSPVSLASIPINASASTSALQTTGNSSLSSIDTSTAAINTKIPSNLTVTSTRLLVDPSGVTSPVSVNSLPLPSGAAISAWQVSSDASINSLLKPASTLTKVTTVDTITNPVTVNSHAVTNAGTFATQAAQSGTWNVTNISGTVSLPTGAATLAAQTSSDTTLTAINGKIPASLTVAATRLLVDGSGVTQPVSGTVTVNALTNASIVKAQLQDNAGTGVTIGQQLAAASLPVILPAATITTLTPPTSVTVTQATGTNLHTVVDSGAVTVTNATATNLKAQSETYQGGVAVSAAAPLQVSLANTAANATAVKTDSSATTQPISAASLPLPSGAAISAWQVSSDASINSLLKPASTLAALTSITNAVTIKADTAGNQANALKVDGTATTQPISAASLPLPSLAATSTKQSDGTQKTQIVDGAGLVISSITPTAGTNALLVASSGVNFINATNNSTVAQLAASATFTGTIEPILSQPAVLVSMTSDQNGTLTLKQYIDAGGTRALPSIVIPVTAGVPINRSWYIAGNYFNLTFQNTGGSTTTTLNISTYYGDMPTITDTGLLRVDNTGSAGSGTTGTVSTVITSSAPSNAKGFILQNLGTSTANIRYGMGITASTTVGIQLAAGQDSGFIPTSANVSVCAESGTQNYSIQWVVQ